MEPVDYARLYSLQDRVLAAVFSGETDFYLTGGTCLHRFHAEDRYSADLDLFTNENALFREDVRSIGKRLENAVLSYTVQVDTRDFVRLFVEEQLQVDLVNDRVYRHGRSLQTAQGYFVDNVENICANKICAVLGRDEPKDVFDLYTIYEKTRNDWPGSISAADKKCVLDPEILEYRLSSFPMNLLDMLHVPDENRIVQVKKNYRAFLEMIRKNC